MDFLKIILIILFPLFSLAAYFPTTIVNQGTSPWVTLEQSTGSNGATIPLYSTIVAGSSSGVVQPIRVDAFGNVGIFGAIFAAQSGTWNVNTTALGQTTADVTGTGSALNADVIASTNVTGYKEINLQLITTGTNTVTFQGSNDNFTTTFSVFCQTVASATTAPASTSNATALFQCPVKYKFFRVRITAFTSGSTSGIASLSPYDAYSLGMQTVSVNGTVSSAQSGAWTVTNNTAVQAAATPVASAARTTSGNSGTLTQTIPNNSAVFSVNVTATSGTGQTLDVVLQKSYNGGTTWVDSWHWERITATGNYVSANMVLDSARLRFVWTIAGTTPSFTFSITSTQGTMNSQQIFRYFDRTIDLNTLNSTSADYFCDGCKTFIFGVNTSACTTFPTLTLETSEDGVNYSSDGTLALTANGMYKSAASTNSAKLMRLKTTVAGSTCSLGYVVMRCTWF